MYCKNCGAKNQNDAIFCKECGGKLEASNMHQLTSQPQQVVNPLPQNDSKKNKMIIIIAIVAVILALSLAVCVGVLLGKSNTGGEANVSQNEIAEEILIPEESQIIATAESTSEPTKEPTSIPTQEPTPIPTEEPVQVPTKVPQRKIELPKDVSEVEMEMGIWPSDPSNGEPVEILQIREWFQDTENNAKVSSTQDGVTCYRKNGELVKIKVDAGYVLGVYDGFLTNNRREYFYRNNQLYFAHIVTATPAGDRFYYVEGNVVRYSDPHDKNHYYNEQISPYMALGYSCRSEGESLFWDNF